MQNTNHWENFRQRQCHIFLAFLTSSGEEDCNFSPNWNLMLRPQAGEMVGIPIITGEGSGLDHTSRPVSHGVLLSTPVRLTCLRVRLTHSPPHTACTETSFVAGVESVWEAPPIGAILSSILGFIVETTTGRVQLLNNLCSKYPLLVSVTFYFLLLVWVTVFVLRVRLPCASLEISEFDT